MQFNIKEIQTENNRILKVFQKPICVPDSKGKGQRYRAKNKAKSEYESLHRTRQKIFDYAVANNWCYYCTFTFDKTKVNDRYDIDLLSKKLTMHINNYKKRNCQTMKHLIIPEQHKDQAWHLHALISEIPSDDLRFYKKDKYYNPMYNWVSFEKKFGFNSIVDISSVSYEDKMKLYGYIVKYITKDLCSQRVNKKRYWSSRGLKVPTKTQYLITDEVLHNFNKNINVNENIVTHKQYAFKNRLTSEIENVVSEYVITR
jgi:hypothetical protein